MSTSWEMLNKAFSGDAVEAYAYGDQIWANELPKMREAQEKARTEFDSLIRTGILSEATRHLTGQKLKSAEDVFFEKFITRCLLLAHGSGFGPINSVSMGPQEEDGFKARGWHGEALDAVKKSESRFVAGLLKDAVPYLWLDDVRTAIVDKAKPRLPAHETTSVQTPHKVMWWAWESDLTFQLPGVGEVTGVGQIILDLGKFGLSLIDILRKDGGAGFVVLFHPLVVYGQKYPDDFHAGSDALYDGTVKMIAFLNSPYVTPPPTLLNRGLRKRMTKAGVTDELLDLSVRLITLRRPESHGSEPSDESEAREWSHRWLVSGHFRNQWYPSRNDHSLIWVPAYVKGPDDKPFKPRGYKVAR